MRANQWSKILTALAVTAPYAQVAHAEVYLTENQAAQIFFPGITLNAIWVTLNPNEVRAIEKSSGERVHLKRIRVLSGPQHEMMIMDQVLGKHEYITYAVAILPDGKIKGIEILEYRETYGYEIRDAQWRKKFEGKSIRDLLKLDKDIPNISGATLSSAHVTNGVRRILQTYEIIKDKV